MSTQTWENRKKRHAYEPTELGDGRWRIKGIETPKPCTRLSALLFAFRNFTRSYAREYLFWEIAHILWAKDREEPLLEKQAWSEKIIHTLARHKRVGFGGCTSSGKSHVVVAWGVVFWLSMPEDTIVNITTTTLKDADQRVWGSVISLMDPLMGAIPCRERASDHEYVYQPEGKKMKTNRGIFLISAEKKKTKEAVGRIIGRKAPNIILIADELGELSPAIMHGFITNLTKGGRRYAQGVGMSNPDSKFDAFGIWVEPKGGWESVDTEHDEGWETKWNGVYVRFDAAQSPHIGRTYSYLPTQADLDEQRELLGENSRGYKRMWRAVFFDGSEDAGVYSEAEIVKSGALSPGPGITRAIGRSAGLDLAYKTGGDRVMFRALEVGYDGDGRMIGKYHPLETIYDDTTSSEPRAYQIADAVVALLIKYKVPASHLAVDATAGGNPICDVIDRRIAESNELPIGLKGRVLRIEFGSKATTRRPNPRVKKTAYEMYTNRATELWFVGKEFMRCRQIFGLDHASASELTLREYDQRKGGTGLRVQLESKYDYKTRTQKPSPDAADTSMLALDAARERLSFFPIERDEGGEGRPTWQPAIPSLSAADAASMNEDAWL